MIVVVGNPAWRTAEPSGPAGLTCGIAIAAAARGRRVELVGRAGDDPAGDSLMIALSRVGVGHVAVLRDPARATRIVDPPPEEDDEAIALSDMGPARSALPVDGTPVLEAADVALGLRYLTSFSVLVLTDEVPDQAIAVALEAADFVSAQLVVVVAPGNTVSAPLPPDATVLERPDDEGGAFAELVGEYVAALDSDVPPGEAFAAAAAGSGTAMLRDVTAQ